MEQVIMEVLRDAGIYDQARRLVASDAELARMFDEDFNQLVSMITNKRPSGGGSQEGRKQRF